MTGAQLEPAWPAAVAAPSSAEEGTLRIAVDGAAGAVVLLDPDLHVLRASPAACRLLATRGEELLGRDLIDFCPDPRSKHDLRSALSSGMPGCELELCVAGRRVDVAIDPGALWDSAGRRRGLVGLRCLDAAAAFRAGLSTDDVPYRQLAESVPNSAVAVFDRDLRIVMAAGEVLTANGQDPDAMTGRLLPDVLDPAVLPLVQPSCRAAIEGRPSQLEFLSPANGRTYRMRLRPVTDPDGTVVGGLSITEDVTDERARQSQLEQIRALAQVGSCSFDVRSGWTMDGALLRLWGLEGGFDSTRLRTEMVYAEDRESFAAGWDEVLRRGGHASTHYRLWHGRTGELRHLQTSVEADVDATGTLMRAVATHVDVTDAVLRREIEANARAQAANERTALLRSVSDSLGGSKQDVWAVAQNLTDLAAGALGDAAVLRILTPDRRSTHDAVAHRDANARVRLARAVARGSASPDSMERIRAEVVGAAHLVSSTHPRPEDDDVRRDLSRRLGDPVAHFIIAPVRHEGTVLGVLWIHRNDKEAPYEVGDDDMVQLLADRIGGAVAAAAAQEAAERERAERDAVATRLQEVTQEQRVLLEQLAETESRERTLLAEAVHDDPLQLIVAAILRVDLLRMRLSVDDSEDAEMDEIATLLETSVERLRQLIVALAPLDLAEGVTPALRRLAEGIFVGTAVTVRTDGPDHLPLSHGAKTTAYRVVREALVNARKHAAARTVTLTATVGPDTVRFAVSDDGTGAPTLDAGPGHLGLATMRARAQADGGELSVHSTLGAGTTVSLVLPRCATPGDEGSDSARS